MTKKIVLSDDTSHHDYLRMHMASRLGCKRDDCDVLHLVRPDPSVDCDLTDVQADVAHYGCTLHTLDVSRLEEILEGDGLFDLIEFDGSGHLKNPIKLLSLLTVVSEQARKLGYDTIILGWPDKDDHLRHLVTKVNDTLVNNASRRGEQPIAFEVYELD